MHQKMSFGELPQDEGQHRVDAAPGRERGIGDVPPSKPGVETDEARSAGQKVKECPVCHARCFSDMDVCYNCLHSFKRNERCRSDDAVLDVKKGAMPTSSHQHFDDGNKALVRESVAVGQADSPLDDQGIDALREADELGFSGRSGDGRACGSTLDLGKVLEIVVSISLSQDACSRHGVAPVVKVETR